MKRFARAAQSAQVQVDVRAVAFHRDELEVPPEVLRTGKRSARDTDGRNEELELTISEQSLEKEGRGRVSDGDGGSKVEGLQVRSP